MPSQADPGPGPGNSFPAKLDAALGYLDASGSNLEALKKQAQEESKKGYAQHVNEVRPGVFLVEDWYDYEQTRASYENGIRLDSVDVKMDAILDAVKKDSAVGGAGFAEKLDALHDALSWPSNKPKLDADATIQRTREGAKAFSSRKSLGDNPYQKGTMGHSDWETGWREKKRNPDFKSSE